MSLMQIPRKIEYALRAMIYLADHPAGVARGTEIATREQIPKYYLEKVIRDLMRRGLVHARRHPRHSYQLPPNATSLPLLTILAHAHHAAPERLFISRDSTASVCSSS